MLHNIKLYNLSWRQVVLKYLSVIVVLLCGKEERDERYGKTNNKSS